MSLLVSDAGSSAYLRNSSRFNTREDIASAARYCIRGADPQPARASSANRANQRRAEKKTKRTHAHFLILQNLFKAGRIDGSQRPGLIPTAIAPAAVTTSPPEPAVA